MLNLRLSSFGIVKVEDSSSGFRAIGVGILVVGPIDARILKAFLGKLRSFVEADAVIPDVATVGALLRSVFWPTAKLFRRLL
jgi:hypothetical protein